MKALLWRTILAVIAVVILFMLIPALLALFGIPMAGPLWTVLRICIGGIAIFYVLTGTSPNPPF